MEGRGSTGSRLVSEVLADRRVTVEPNCAGVAREVTKQVAIRCGTTFLTVALLALLVVLRPNIIPVLGGGGLLAGIAKLISSFRK